MENKKPTLSQFGLTKQLVEDNEYAKKNRQKIIRENEEIDKNAAKYGWIAFFVSLVLLLMIGAGAGSGDLSVVFAIIAGVVGGVTCAITKSTKKEVPIYRKDIEDKYQRYLKAVSDYERYESLSKVRVSRVTPLTEAKETAKNKTTTKSKTTKTTSAKSTVSESRTIPTPIVKPIEPPVKTKINKPTDYQVGMIVKHSSFGVGKIVHINDDKSLIDVKFEEELNYKKFMTNIVKLEILETPKPKPEPKVVEQPKPVEIPKPSVVEKVQEILEENEEPSIVYENSKIGLTKSQEEIFNKMLDISLKFCVDLQIDDRKQIVGVGLPNQEKLRYYISKKSNKIYVKFTDSEKQILLNEANKDILLDMTRKVNDRFESNPERYQLYKYKEEQKQKYIEEQIREEPDDIFDVDEDTSEIGIKETTETSTDIVFDKTIFSIDNTTLVKCFEKKMKSFYEIPNGVTEIADNAFADNSAVYNLTIPETITKIGNNAFKNCSKLRDLVLPGSIKEIGSNAFDGCENLETIFCNTKAVKKLLVDLPKHIEIVCLEF